MGTCWEGGVVRVVRIFVYEVVVGSLIVVCGVVLIVQRRLEIGSIIVVWKGVLGGKGEFVRHENGEERSVCRAMKE